MSTQTSGTENSIANLEGRDVRALTEHMSVLPAFGDAEAGEYVVVSESGSQYDVDVLTGECTCPDHEHRNAHCKHLRGVEFATGRRSIPSWVDRDAINNTLGDHITEGPVFESDVDEEPAAVAEATERVLTDGGRTESALETLGDDPENPPACLCEVVDASELGCFEHFSIEEEEEASE